MPNKPKVILQLEKDLGFELEQVELGEIGEYYWERRANFALNEQGEVVGLRLNKCEIEDLSQLQGLTALTWLGLWNNQIIDLSPLQGLTALTELNLDSNQISDLSPLQGLTALTRLDLSDNQIIDLNPLQGLTALTYVDLRRNQIIDLSPLQGLTALTELDLWANQINDLSPLKGLTALTELNLNSNKIIDLSPLQGLTALTKLSLGSNQIIDLSPLQGLTALTELNLDSNQISDLSPLQGLTALTELNLDSNQISDLSPLQGLTALTELNLDSNQISDLSPLQGLTALTWLDLFNNQITDLSPLQGLTALTWLNLSENQIIDLSPLQGLTALTGLILWNNQIIDLSPLQGLTALTRLILWNNQIQEITLDFLNRFPQLETLYLHDNPIKNIPEEIFTSGNISAMRHYFEDLEKQQIQTYQAKVILIGNGRVGKTCLLKRWLDNTFDEKEPSTHAIQLRHYPLKKLAKEKQFKAIQLHIWDFGGQDIYHATHRLFMQTKAIFVLVWDAQTEKEPEQKEGDHPYRNYPLNYWLDYAKNLGDNSPILIVQTKKQRDGEQIPKNLADLRQNYNIIAAIAVESSQDKHNGFTFFEQHLMEQVEKLLEKTCVIFPKSWWDVQTQLQKWQTSKKTLSLTEFNKLCQKFGLDNEHAHTLLKYLHDTSWVFYQENLFQNQIILDQKWAIDAVYTLFDRNGIFPELAKSGEFSIAQLKHVWQQFDEAEQELFLDFMESCEICFEVDCKHKKTFSERCFIAPALLPEEKPKPSNLWLNAQKWFVRYQYRFLHYGNLQSFIVRTHQWAERASLWKNGCELDDDQGNSALIEGLFNAEKPYLQIMVAGNNPQNLLDKVRNEFDEIQQDDQVEEWWSLNGEDFVRRIDVENAPKQNRQIQTINGVWANIEDFKSFFNRDKNAKFLLWEEQLKPLKKHRNKCPNNSPIQKEITAILEIHRADDVLIHSRKALECIVRDLYSKNQKTPPDKMLGKNLLDLKTQPFAPNSAIIDLMFKINEQSREGAHPSNRELDNNVPIALSHLDSVLKWFCGEIQKQ
jgi:internalin A